MIAHNRLFSMLLVGLAFSILATACSGNNDVSSTRQPNAPTLDADAIGAVDMGQPPSAAIDEMTALFGAPDEDSFWIAADSALYGSCPGVALRAVGWGSLYLFFIADEEVTPENENVASRLYTYSYGYDFSRNEGATDPRELNLVTASGIGLGSTRSELRAAHGEALVEAYNEAADTWTWSVNQPTDPTLAGLLSGPEDEATVVLIERVPGCGSV